MADDEADDGDVGDGCVMRDIVTAVCASAKRRAPKSQRTALRALPRRRDVGERPQLAQALPDTVTPALMP